MKKTLLFTSLIAAAFVGMTSASFANESGSVTELMTKALPDIPGKEATMIIVDYPPGASDPAHHHDAHVFVYVLEGQIVMGVEGGEEVTLSAGDIAEPVKIDSKGLIKKLIG